MQEPKVEAGNQEEGQQEARLQGREAEGPEVEQVGQGRRQPCLQEIMGRLVLRLLSGFTLSPRRGRGQTPSQLPPWRTAPVSQGWPTRPSSLLAIGPQPPRRAPRGSMQLCSEPPGRGHPSLRWPQWLHAPWLLHLPALCLQGHLAGTHAPFQALPSRVRLASGSVPGTLHAHATSGTPPRTHVGGASGGGGLGASPHGHGLPREFSWESSHHASHPPPAGGIQEDKATHPVTRSPYRKASEVPAPKPPRTMLNSGNT